MASLFDRLFPRLKRGGPTAETTIEPRNPYQPLPNEPKDPILEMLREEQKAQRVFHTYGYEEELEQLAVYLMNHKNHPTRREREASTAISEELKKEEGEPLVLGNPNTMWAYGVGGACIGFAIAGVLMRKHVEPLTTVVFTSFSGLGGYIGSKLDELGYLPPLSILSSPSPPFPPQVPNRSPQLT